MRRLAWSCFPWFTSSSFVCFFRYFQHIIFDKYGYPFHALHIYNIPLRLCVNQSKSVLLTAISMYGNGLFWENKAKQENTRQGVALCQLDKTGGGAVVLKYSVSLRISGVHIAWWPLLTNISQGSINLR